MWDALRLDVRHSFRSLRRAPAFSFIVIVTLTLALGATMAVVSLLNAIVFRTLAVPSPRQLVALSASDPQTKADGYFYADTFNAYRSAQRSFAQMSMYSNGGLTHLEAPSGASVDASTETVSASDFDLVGARLSAGRFFTDSDEGVVIITEGFRRRIFGNGPGVGETVKLDTMPATVIGVVADAPYEKLDDPRPLVVFRPIMQEVARAQFPMAYVRASGDSATVRGGYKRVINALGHRLPRDFFVTSSEWVDRALLQERFLAGLGTFAAAITLVLACIGVYGLLAYSVTARVREIGVRVALGAERATVVWMIVRDGLALAVPGVVIGLPCAWAAATLVRARLYGIAVHDPRTLLGAAAVFLATAIAASWLPALRASRIAPVDALREE